VDLLKEDFGIPVEIFDPFRRITVPNNIVPEMVREQGPRMTVAVGLALRSFDES